MGKSCFIHISLLQWLFGEGKCTSCHFKRSKNSFQGINSLLHLKSFKKMHSDVSTPIHACLSFVGLLNVLKMICSGSNKNIFTQLAESMIIIFLNFPRPCSISKNVRVNVAISNNFIGTLLSTIFFCSLA